MRFFYTFFIMFGFWILLSGKFDPFHLTLGVISSMLVAFMSADLIFSAPVAKGRAATAMRFMKYIPWLLREIMLSALQVTYLALHPRMRTLIEPRIVTFKSKLKSNVAQVALANSITLTPGTITIRVVDGEFYVHALSRRAAESLPGEMEERLAKVFQED